MDMLVTSWTMVTKATIINCFAKAGLSDDLKGQALLNEGDPFKDLMEEIEKMPGSDQESAPLSANAYDFLNFDNELITASAFQTEVGILAERLGDEVLKDSQEDDIICDEDPITRPTPDDFRNAMDVVSLHCLLSEHGDILR